jgi:hypothetical protein
MEASISAGPLQGHLILLFEMYTARGIMAQKSSLILPNDEIIVFIIATTAKNSTLHVSQNIALKSPCSRRGWSGIQRIIWRSRGTTVHL